MTSYKYKITIFIYFHKHLSTIKTALRVGGGKEKRPGIFKIRALYCCTYLFIATKGKRILPVMAKKVIR